MNSSELERAEDAECEAQRAAAGRRRVEATTEPCCMAGAPLVGPGVLHEVGCHAAGRRRVEEAVGRLEARDAVSGAHSAGEWIARWEQLSPGQRFEWAERIIANEARLARVDDLTTEWEGLAGHLRRHSKRSSQRLLNLREADRLDVVVERLRAALTEGGA